MSTVEAPERFEVVCGCGQSLSAHDTREEAEERAARWRTQNDTCAKNARAVERSILEAVRG